MQERLPTAPPDVTDISYLDHPTATCIQPVRNLDTCYINWYTLNTQADSPYLMESMTVYIDGIVRLRSSGFFQTSLALPTELYQPGLQVPCGSIGSGGHPQLGAIHYFQIDAKETSGQIFASYGSVTCPASTPQVFIPYIRR